MESEHGWNAPQPVRFPNGRWEMTFSRALWRRADGRLEYALPYSVASPWPLTELFCFARLDEIDGCGYIVYAFGENKQPIF